MRSPSRFAWLLAVLLWAAAFAQAPSLPIDEVRKRAEAGDAAAQFELALAYEGGNRVGRDMAEAERWYRRSAEGGFAEAQNSLGSIHQERREYEAAASWYRKAAGQRNASALNSLAYLHDLGLGVPQDRQQAYALYLQSADLGWAEAMLNIAVMMDQGQVGKPDAVVACTWLMRAVRFASPSDGRLNVVLRRAVPKVERALPEPKLEQCRRDAENWQPAALPSERKP